MKDCTLEVSKRELLNQQYNSMVANNWCKINFKLFNKDRSRVRKFFLIVMVDAEDLYEYYRDEDLPAEENENRPFSKKDILDYAAELAYDTVEGYIKDYYNYPGLQEVIKDSIDKYNQCGRW